jgi:hypothetical protein
MTNQNSVHEQKKADLNLEISIIIQFKYFCILDFLY